MMLMTAGNLKTYPVFGIRGRNYVDMTDNVNPVTVWTPDCKPGEYRIAPNIIGEEKMPSKTTMSEDIAAIRQALTPKAGRLSSGEWYQVRKRLEETNPDTELGMVFGNYEATATLADFRHGRRVEKNGVVYFDGLLIQHPETDGKTLLANREGREGFIKARDVWQMPLPLNGGHVKELLQKNPDLGTFFDTIYGMRDAGKQLPGDYVYLSWPFNPDGRILNLLRGGWLFSDPLPKRVPVDGRWGPYESGVSVASRAAVSGRIVLWPGEAAELVEIPAESIEIPPHR
jgi:hypothetical protein